MYISEALHRISPEQKSRIARMHLGNATDEVEDSSALESTLKSYLTIRNSINKAGPPAFSILKSLCFSAGHKSSKDLLRISVSEEVIKIRSDLVAKRILFREEGLELYRKVFFEARKSDLRIDPCEDSILALLRSELGISLAEHHLLEYHDDFSVFWNSIESNFDKVVRELIDCGLLYEFDAEIFLPHDLVESVIACIGVELSRSNHEKLLNWMTMADLGLGADLFKISISGAKSERISVLLDNFVPPRAHLHLLGGTTLKEICDHLDVAGYGTKDAMISKIFDALLNPKTDRGAIGVIELEAKEPRVLEKEQFVLLFSRLKGHQISYMLQSIQRATRTTGGKSQLVDYIWEIELSECTLLGFMTNAELDDLLAKLELRLPGSKSEKIQRLIEAAKSNKLVPVGSTG